jgi:hypothetical protein
MPADIFPTEVIDRLASRLDSPCQLLMLRRVRAEGFIQNDGRLTPEEVEVLDGLADFGLVDPGYAGPVTGLAFNWLGNANGERVLRLIEGRFGGAARMDEAEWLA